MPIDSDVASLVAEFSAVFQPVNALERLAIERIAHAHHSLMNSYQVESGLLAFGLKLAHDVANNTEAIGSPEPSDDSYWMAAGFHECTQNGDWQVLLRLQAQAERLYRRAVEEFERLRALRGSFPEEQELVSEEPSNEEPAAKSPIPFIPNRPRQSRQQRRAAARANRATQVAAVGT